MTISLLPQYLVNGILAGMIYAVFTSGYSLIFATSRFMHIANGGILSLCGMLTWYCAVSGGMPIAAAILIGMAAALLTGVFIELCIYRHLRANGLPFLLTMIVSLGCMIVIQSLLALLLGNNMKYFPSSAMLPTLFIGSVAIPGWQLVCFGISGLLLIAMGTYRSPAVALMPDVTPKPLRSRANAIINLMGAVGGILYLVITSVLYSSSRVAGLEHVNYLPLFAIVAGIMAVSVGILFAAIREKKLHEENMALEAEHPEWNLAEVDESGNEKLPSAVRRSLGFLLASIALWFIGYNAIETWFTTFADKMWGMALGDATLCLTIATAGAICSYIPVGIAAACHFGVGQEGEDMGGMPVKAFGQ